MKKIDTGNQTVHLHLFLSHHRDLPQRKNDVKEIRQENKLKAKVRKGLKVKAETMSKADAKST